MIIIFCTLIAAQNKAILFSGSMDWENYRHQADIWTIYQILMKRGFTKQNILIACYDDIAQNGNNIFQGKIFHDENYENVYGGSDSLNFKNQITADTFYNMLRNPGTTENDNLFIYYDDHGGQGILSVPNEESGMISVDELSDVFLEMNNRKLFKNCLFVIEACNSGSIGSYMEDIFDLYNVKNVAIITAARANESSLSSQNDVWVNTPLSNEFTIAFIDKIRQSPDFSISELFDYLGSEVKGSTPCYYGDENIKNLRISDLIGTAPPEIVQKAKKVSQIPEHSSFQFEAKLGLKSKEKRTQSEGNAQKKTEFFNQIIDKISQKIKPFISKKSIQKALDEDLKVTNDYLEIFNRFYKKFGPVPAKDLSEISTKILKLSAIASKEKIIEAMDEI